jgi:glycosyltransferase involved in cell wall biosynthesis
MQSEWSHRYDSAVRIGIDCRFAAGQTGLGRYTRGIVTALLARSDPVDYTLFVAALPEPWLQKLQEHFPCTKLRLACFPHYSVAEQLRFPVLLRGSGIEVYFAPHFNVPLLCPVPFVATIHDLILHRFPGGASTLRRVAYRLQMRTTVSRASALLVPSTFTALELGGRYGTSAHRKTTVVGEGVHAHFRPVPPEGIAAVRRRYRLERPFLLYIGSAKLHKNFSLLLEAYREAALHDCDLVLVTADPGEPSLPTGVRCVADVPDEDLPALLSAAECFVTASLYEGFCLPIAEALACGCPVIASKRAAIPETAAGHATLVEPTVEAFAAALQNPPKRPVGNPGHSWERSAERTANVLLHALHQ